MNLKNPKISKRMWEGIYIVPCRDEDGFPGCLWYGGTQAMEKLSSRDCASCCFAGCNLAKRYQNGELATV